jgi:hypothetical protein
MTTIIIDDKSVGAKKIIEYIKTLPYAKIIDESEPNKVTLRAVNEIKTGKTNSYKNTEDLFVKLRKKANA